MRALRDPRISAGLLALAAITALVLANTAAAEPTQHLLETQLGWTVHEWLQDGLLALFFFTAGAELRQEFQHGTLSSPRRAAIPFIAALGGVLVPIAIYLAGAPRTQLAGWPVPTPTDIAFSLGVLALFGRPGNGRLRAFLLALCVIDDVIGLVFVTAIGGFDPHRIPTLAAVAIGLALPSRIGHAMQRALEPWVNVVVLPLFAFAASFVPIGGFDADHVGIAVWTAVALVVGKAIGVTGAGWLGNRLLVREHAERHGLRELVSVGLLGGIGFTVALLLARLAFAADDEAANAATVGVLVGSGVAVVLSAVALRLMPRRQRP